MEQSQKTLTLLRIHERAATARIIRIAELEKENENLKAKLANRDLNLADRDRRIENLESDILLIASLLQTVGEAAGKVTNQITSMEDIARKMADRESGWNQ